MIVLAHPMKIQALIVVLLTGSLVACGSDATSGASETGDAADTINEPTATELTDASIPEVTDTNIPDVPAANIPDVPDTIVPEVTDTNVNEANDPEELVIVGQVRTIEFDNVILSSLPDSVASIDQERVELGRLLFWDPILSGDMDVACASCHLPQFGYGDGRARSIGVGGIGAGPSRAVGHTGIVPRNAPTVLNTAWNGITELGFFDPELAPMFWDVRTQSLAAQALEPIRSREEMRGDNFTIAEMEAEVVDRLSNNADYQARFQAIFGEDEVNLSMIGQILADFQTTLVANNAPFDRWMRGEANAMSAQQIEGMEEFVETGCAECHTGPLFSDFETHVLGVPEANGLDTPDNGDGDFGFRTPSLRQLAFTAPYFHGGQRGSLDDVIDFYDNPGPSENPNVPTNSLDADFRNLPNINGRRANLIEQFLNALNDPDFDRSRPESVPSGLPVGGLIE